MGKSMRNQPGIVELSTVSDCLNTRKPAHRRTILTEKYLTSWSMMRYLSNAMDWTYRFLRVLILIGLVSWPAVGEKARFRTFTNKEGKKIEASVVDIQGKDLEIVMKSGKKFKLPIAS